MARLLMQALERACFRPELASELRTLDRAGDPQVQDALARQSRAEAARLLDRYGALPEPQRPCLWFTYHCYYKAPDWIGPVVADALGIPYVIAEASHAAKRALGPWATGHEGSVAAIRKASLVLCPSRDDIPGLRELIEERRILHLPPFLDVALYRAASANRAARRAELAAERKLDPATTWIAVVAMMRAGDKLASYRTLAAALARLDDQRWRLLVVGDGAMRGEVESMFDERATFLGALGQSRIAEVLAACDLYAWPAVNEAYGMALLEAEAAGIPVVSCATRGVPDVVADGRTGVLVPYGDEEAFAAALRGMIGDPARRAALGAEAARFVATERSLEAASASIKAALAAL
jgi:glycosyltransferase involved in cell wall biosynthesis